MIESQHFDIGHFESKFVLMITFIKFMAIFSFSISVIKVSNFITWKKINKYVWPFLVKKSEFDHFDPNEDP
jgi:hypothetical protein